MLPRNDVYTDFQGFTQMRKEARQQTPEAIKQVAKQFESLFVQMMLKSMRDAVPDGGLFSSDQQRMYQDMFDKQLSLNISNGRGLGLAPVIERQLGGEAAAAVNEKQLQDYMHSPIAAQQWAARLAAIDHPYGAQPANSRPAVHDWQRPEQFVDDLWPHAVEAGKRLGVDPQVLIAQSALETGWGQQMRQLPNGDNSYSLFGIKAHGDWPGKTLAVSTLEYREGSMQREQARFRAYDSIGDAFRDYVDFIESSPRYQRALEHGFNADAYARELQRAGYATDPDYAAKIQRVRNSELLQTRVSALKNDASVPLT
jgi:flagellar protein FlgJ